MYKEKVVGKQKIKKMFLFWLSELNEIFCNVDNCTSILEFDPLKFKQQFFIHI